MTFFSRNASLSSLLTRMNVLVSGVVLLLAALAFFSYDLFSFRQSLIVALEADAQIVGDNSVSAILFNDQQSAIQTLASLQHSPNVAGAIIRMPDGLLFARYGAVSPSQKASIHNLAPGENDRWWPSPNERVLVAHRVTFEGKTVGIVYVVGSLAEMHQRARRYALISGLILLLCMAASLPLSAWSRRWITEPMASLAATAMTVSRQRDYTLRAETDGNSREIRTLVSAFNGMLAQIQQRDQALTEARDELEARVEARTAELRAANRELEAFSYTVAHDLRGPLDAVSGIVFLLTQNAAMESEGQAREMLEQLKTSTAGMAVLIDDLLHFARATTAPVKREGVNMSAMAREIAADLHRSHPERRAHFVIAELPEVETDGGLLHIVLDNLLRNAWKYTSHHADALIEFGGKPQGDGMIYFVRDDGAGFDTEGRERLFQPFQRLHSKSEFPGTGIGLATVERILKRLGGRIWAEGVIEVGAAFYFTLGRE
jgi:signal transduction histidine kinase